MHEMLPEPWMRGPDVAVHPIARPFGYALTQVREDLDTWTRDLTTDEMWARPMGLGSIGFHIRHIGRSADRLTTYLQNHPLTADQMAALASEMEPGASRTELFRELDLHLLRTEAIVDALDPRTWYDSRTVGRKRLPTTVGGLVSHIAEHSQRHTGEAIVTVKVVRALRPSTTNRPISTTR